jgi:hypothetical protein
MIILAAESFRAVEGISILSVLAEIVTQTRNGENPTNTTTDAVYSLINKEFANEDD